MSLEPVSSGHPSKPWMLFGCGAPAHLHVGESFRFGCRGSGDVSLLKDWGASHGMQVHCHELLHVSGLPVSSTRIRDLMAQGKLDHLGIGAGTLSYYTSILWISSLIFLPFLGKLLGRAA